MIRIRNHDRNCTNGVDTQQADARAGAGGLGVSFGDDTVIPGRLTLELELVDLGCRLVMIQ